MPTQACASSPSWSLLKNQPNISVCSALFFIYAIEDYSKIPAVEKILREDFKDVVGTTDSPEKTQTALKGLETRRGFFAWNEIPDSQQNIAVTEMLTNVNPYYIQWGIMFMRLKRDLGIDSCRWSPGD